VRGAWNRTDSVARYELGAQLGEGGVGEVLMARDNDIDRDVAVKRLRGETKTSQAAVLRFADEVRTIGGLEHPNIVPIHDVGTHANGDYFFVMKYVQGETLETIIEKLAAGDLAYHARFGVERRVEIMMGILEAVAYAHSKRIIHRDLKPANVMVGPYGEVVVMDWGLARTIGSADPKQTQPCEPRSSGRLLSTHAGEILGTPAYMSPEQARGEALDERSDTYSLCVLFYELLTLRHPHGDHATLEGMLEAIQSVRGPLAVMVSTDVQSRTPTDLSWFLEKGLRKDKDERFQTVDAMLERLRERAAGSVPIQCPVTLQIQATNVVQRALRSSPFFYSTLVLLGGIALVAFAALGIASILH